MYEYISNKWNVHVNSIYVNLSGDKLKFVQ